MLRDQCADVVDFVFDYQPTIVRSIVRGNFFHGVRHSGPIGRRCRDRQKLMADFCVAFHNDTFLCGCHCCCYCFFSGGSVGGREQPFLLVGGVGCFDDFVPFVPCARVGEHHFVR